MTPEPNANVHVSIANTVAASGPFLPSWVENNNFIRGADRPVGEIICGGVVFQG
jgi:hypothetical protein